MGTPEQDRPRTPDNRQQKPGFALQRNRVAVRMMRASLMPINSIHDNLTLMLYQQVGQPDASLGINGYVLFIACVLVLAALAMNWRVLKMFFSAVIDFQSTIKKITETADNRLDAVEKKMESVVILTASTESKITTHDQRAETYISASTAREIEILNIAKELPDHLDTILTALEAFREAAEKQLDAIQQQSNNQIEVTRAAIRDSFTEAVNVALVSVQRSAITAQEPPNPVTVPEVEAAPVTEPLPSESAASVPGSAEVREGQ